MAKLTVSEVQAILKGEKSDALSAAESSKLSVYSSLAPARPCSMPPIAWCIPHGSTPITIASSR